jgi:membrane protease subunit HflK
LVWLASGFYIVDASQRGLVLQFGEYKESTESGLRWRLPYPIRVARNRQYFRGAYD